MSEKIVGVDYETNKTLQAKIGIGYKGICFRINRLKQRDIIIHKEFGPNGVAHYPRAEADKIINYTAMYPENRKETPGARKRKKE